MIEDDGPASPGSIAEGAPDSDDPDTSKVIDLQYKIIYFLDEFELT